jgi:hypothetical protein
VTESCTSGTGRWPGTSGGGIMTGESSEGASSAAAAEADGSAEVTKPIWRNRGSTPPDEERGGCPSVREGGRDGGARVREAARGCRRRLGQGRTGRRIVGLVSSGFRAHLPFEGRFSFLNDAGLVVLDLLMWTHT